MGNIHWHFDALNSIILGETKDESEQGFFCTALPKIFMVLFLSSHEVLFIYLLV